MPTSAILAPLSVFAPDWRFRQRRKSRTYCSPALPGLTVKSLTRAQAAFGPMPAVSSARSNGDNIPNIRASGKGPLPRFRRFLTFGDSPLALLEHIQKLKFGSGICRLIAFCLAQGQRAKCLKVRERASSGLFSKPQNSFWIRSKQVIVFAPMGRPLGICSTRRFSRQNQLYHISWKICTDNFSKRA
jgi:hypothetical protein